MIMYANRTGTHLSRKNCSAESVQREAVDEYRRALLAPLSEAPYGSRTASPKLVTLSKHVSTGDNRVAETTVALAFGALSLGVGIEAVCKPFRVIDGMLRAQVPAPHRSLEELHRLETQIEGECNVLQMEYLVSDKSDRVKRKMLEKFEAIYAVIGELIAQLRKDLFGGPHR